MEIEFVHFLLTWLSVCSCKAAVLVGSRIWAFDSILIMFFLPKLSYSLNCPPLFHFQSLDPLFLTLFIPFHSPFPSLSSPPPIPSAIKYHLSLPSFPLASLSIYPFYLHFRPLAVNPKRLCVLNMYWNKWALVLVCFSFFFFIFWLSVLGVHVKLFFRFVSIVYRNAHIGT